jgi:hypothetical protein
MNVRSDFIPIFKAVKLLNKINIPQADACGIRAGNP